MKSQKFNVSIEKKRSWQTNLLGWLFSHLGLLLMSAGYALLGAVIFIQIELPLEEQQRSVKLSRNEDINASVAYLRNMFWIYANTERFNYSRTQFENQVSEDLNSLKKLVVDYHRKYKYDGTDKWEYHWTFPKALLFTITIMTTIGYGYNVPRTNLGKMLTIVYSLVGIPLLLVFMAKIGDLMGSVCLWTYNRICCGWCRFRRKKSQLEKLETEDDRFDDDFESYEAKNVPIFICILLVLTFTLLGGFTFSKWENWPLATSVYFCFITLTTAGFGDFVPIKTFTQYNNGTIPMMKMIFTVSYIVFGIALVSMCIQFMQEETKAKIARMSESIGLKKKKLSKVRRLKMKASLEQFEIATYDEIVVATGDKTGKNVENADLDDFETIQS